MRLSNGFAAAILACLVASAPGCASTPEREGTGEYFDDTLITIRVKAAIFNDPSLKSSEINVETYKGAVQLSGFVSSDTNVSRAIDIARAIKGVTTVTNDMRSN